MENKYLTDLELFLLAGKTLDFLHDKTKDFKQRNLKKWTDLSLCEQMFLDGYITAKMDEGYTMKDETEVIENDN